MTDTEFDPGARLEGIRRALTAVANDRPTPEQIAEWNAADKAMAQRVRAALPGVPLHHAYAVLQAVRVTERLDAAAAPTEPAGVAPAADRERSAGLPDEGEPPTANLVPVAARPLDLFHDEMMAKAAADHQKRMADEAALRDRIAKALSDARRPGLGGMTEADAVAYMADAVLSVLPVTAGQADRAAADLTTARATNQRLHLRAQQLESELAAYRRAVADWEITDTSTYVPLRTLAVIAKAAGISVPDRWELHYQRVERAEADRAAVAELAQAIRLTREYVGADLLPAVEGWSWYDALRRHAPHELPADDASRMAAVPAGSADAGHSGGETQPRRGDQFEAWLKAQRDLCFDYPSAWGSVDGLLDRYRLHADTGTPLGEHVCESRMVGDCDCLETEPARRRGRARQGPVVTPLARLVDEET